MGSYSAVPVEASLVRHDRNSPRATKCDQGLAKSREYDGVIEAVGRQHDIEGIAW